MPMLHEMEIWLQIKLAGSRARPIDCGRVTNLSVRPEQSVDWGCIVAAQAAMPVVGSQG
jgi:hypothetical protein